MAAEVTSYSSERKLKENGQRVAEHKTLGYPPSLAIKMFSFSQLQTVLAGSPRLFPQRKLFSGTPLGPAVTAKGTARQSKPFIPVREAGPA